MPNRISVGVDCGNRMGLAAVDVETEKVLLCEAVIAKSIARGGLGEALCKAFILGADADPDEREPMKVWIEEPGGYVMQGHMAEFGVRHKTNVRSIFMIGVAAGRAAEWCAEHGVPCEFITATAAKEGLMGDPAASKVAVALYLEALGYTLPQTRQGTVDHECSDALCVAIAGARLMKQGQESDD